MDKKVRSKRVLICEDNEECRLLLRAKLAQQGFEVVGEAVTGYESLQLFMQEKPDLILLDLGMPMGSGLTVLRFIREIDQSTQIVILTADNKEKTVKVALRLGANDYLVKDDLSRGSIHSPRFMKALGSNTAVESVEETKPEETMNIKEEDENAALDLLEAVSNSNENEQKEQQTQKDDRTETSQSPHRMARPMKRHR